MKRRAWLKFYVHDWLTDPLLRTCSPQARGMLMDLICLAHDAEPYGYIPGSGSPQEIALISRGTGLRRDFSLRLLDELLRLDRVIRAADGRLYIKRMVQMAVEEAVACANGMKGGNPALVRRDNPPHKATHKLEKRREDKDTPPTPQGGTGRGGRDTTSPPLGTQRPQDAEAANQPSEKPEPRMQGPPTRRLSPADKRRLRVQANTPLMARINAWFRRRPDTLWTLAEAEALAQLNLAGGNGQTAEDVRALELYYTAERMPEPDYRRRDLPTLLNNWAGEVDRAKRWMSQ